MAIDTSTLADYTQWCNTKAFGNTQEHVATRNAEQKWQVRWEDPIRQKDHPLYTSILHQIYNHVTYGKLAYKSQPISRIFTTRMTNLDVTTQKQAQFNWHHDAEGTITVSWIHVTYTGPISNGGALEYGGAVHLSKRADGGVCFDNRHGKAHSSDYFTIHPSHNSVYIFPGYFVTHAVAPVMFPNTIRYATVAFIRLRTKCTLGGTYTDTFLRRQWAQSMAPTALVCDHQNCSTVAKTKQALVKHKQRYHRTTPMLT